MCEKPFYVYKTTYIPDGRVYIGKSKYRPGYKNYYGSGVYISRMIKAHGKENFSKEILGEYETEEEAFEAEKFYIKEYNSQNLKIGFNLSSGGGDSDASERFLKRTGKKATFSRRESDELRTVLGSSEYREKQRKISQNIWDNYDDEKREWRRIKASEVWTPERRQARRDMLKARLENPETSKYYRENLSKAVRASNLRPEVIQKRKEAMQKVGQRKEYRELLKERQNQPWNKELNSRVRGPLSQISRKLKAGKISEEEAKIEREALYKIQEEIHLKYEDEWSKYLEDHPNKWRKNK